MKEVSAPKVVTAIEASESALPPQIEETLVSSSGQRGGVCSH